MAKDDIGMEVPQQEIESLARLFLPKIRQFFESEEGQREFAEWKQQQAQEATKEAK
ncbi:conserved hypothetical protein [uncultured Eubacteriales bacterium]|uniref:Uncharacterized protein n=1 Tax=uncultured Eubacteriales bacterium TaxID=172733 RepID=A0A212JB93_9FIRM|nr:conserved hypothetical protein [uncultured Eubacteriales bacterium]